MADERLHFIKLKGPWSVRLVPPDSRRAQTVQLPADWNSIFGVAAGTADFQRRFNRPTGLTAGHRVRIQFRDVIGLVGVHVNDQPQAIDRGPDGVDFVDVTDCLQPHNVLNVEIRFDPREHPGRPGGLWQPVAIVIEEPAETQL